MIGLGTIINTVAIIVGGIIGLFCGKLMSEDFRKNLACFCGITVIFIGISGALKGMMTINEDSLDTVGTLMVVLSIVLGGIIGQIINFERIFAKFGEWLKAKSGNSKDNKFLDGFLTASFTVCIGAMAIVGSIEDGINHNITILVTKSILDFIMLIVFAGIYGVGAIFSCIPVFLIQGLFTVLGALIGPLLSDVALNNLSTVGSILIFCVGINLVFDRKIPVANMLPALLIAVGFAYLGINI